MSDNKSPGLIRKYLRRFFGSIGLMFIPIPVGIFRRQLAGKSIEGDSMEFYSHPDFVCTMHLIWVGWLVTLGVFYNNVVEEEWQISDNFLSWPWLFVLTITIIVMGLQFSRVVVGFLLAGIAVSGMGLFLIQALKDFPVFEYIAKKMDAIPVIVEWGVPMVVSLILGIIFVCVATWRRMNDCWSIKAKGNYLEHENFQEKDRTISKGAKTFVAVFPCLMRRYLFFGYGNIEVRSSTGTTLIDLIDGVFFARYHADIIKFRFSTTDVSLGAEEEETEEEEAAAAEDVM
ncbi:MAG: hypothetical protein IH899_14130 [Planctomycetes bacterium]|nr:hypothetical protein [Planctomycetota bacterium]